MARSSRPAAALIAAAAAATLAACGSGAPTTSAPSGNPPAPTSTSASPTASVSTPPQPRASSPSSGPPASPTPSRPGACLSGTLRVLYPGSDNPLRSTCVHPGVEIVIALTAQHPYQWAPVVSSAPAVVTVMNSRTDPGGTTITTLRTLRPGTATLSSASTFTPDPHGPPSRGWQLLVTVGP